MVLVDVLHKTEASAKEKNTCFAGKSLPDFKESLTIHSPISMPCVLLSMTPVSQFDRAKVVCELWQTAACLTTSICKSHAATDYMKIVQLQSSMQFLFVSSFLLYRKHMWCY